MRALLDLNFLIALFDPIHVFHHKAHEWWAENHVYGWASSTITELGVIRIMSNPKYSEPEKFTVAGVTEQLMNFVDSSDHEFWEADRSIIKHSLLDFDRVLSYKSLTDLFLLALATERSGRFVTFDMRISIDPIRESTSANLVQL